jgi:hypothetical protein
MLNKGLSNSTSYVLISRAICLSSSSVSTSLYSYIAYITVSVSTF